MPLNADSQALVDRMRSSPPIHELGVEAARQISAHTKSAPGPEVGSVEDRNIPSVDGEVAIRVYTPVGEGPFPALVVIHGGGFVMGSVNTLDGHARRHCDRLGCVVVSVDYRLAPEAKFPLPLEDCYAAVKWVAEQAEELGVDATRIAIAGESTGGNLAAATALLARDRSGPNLVGQVLVVPLLDRNYETASWKDYSQYPPFPETMEWFWEQYLHPDDDATSPYVVPLRSDDLTGLPPTLVITAEADPLRDDGERYAERLAEAGVDVQSTRYDGVAHMFYLMAGILQRGDEAFDLAQATLEAMFGQPR